MNLGGAQAVKSMSPPSSSISRNSSDRVSDQFPAGLRVLVVDDDPTDLRILEKLLKNCLYEVTGCNRAELALDYLRGNKKGHDIVITNVHMPGMDGFKLLERIGLEMDLPVIMTSADDSEKVVMKGITHGAVDYVIKPVMIGELKNIWQHVVRKKKDASPLKKPNFVWSVELHQQFLTAVNHLGLDRAVPKKILELMNAPGLTRINVASHLQKYRFYLRRVSQAFGPMYSMHGIDLQAPAASGQPLTPKIVAYCRL